MQVTDLNRTVNHILVGTLAIAAIAFLFWNRLVMFAVFLFEQPQLQMLEPKDIASLAPLAAALLLALTPTLIALSIFFGVAIEGLSDLLLQDWLSRRFLYKEEAAQWFLGLKENYALTARLRKQCETLLLANKKYTFPETTSDEKLSLATVLFFQSAQPDNIKWTLYNYSVSVLVSGFALVLPLFFIGIIWNGISWLWMIPLLFLLYILIHLMARREQYTYESIFRQAILVLSEKDEEPEAPKEETTKQFSTTEGSAAHTSTVQSGEKHLRAERRR